MTMEPTGEMWNVNELLQPKRITVQWHSLWWWRRRQEPSPRPGQYDCDDDYVDNCLMAPYPFQWHTIFTVHQRLCWEKRNCFSVSRVFRGFSVDFYTLEKYLTHAWVGRENLKYKTIDQAIVIERWWRCLVWMACLRFWDANNRPKAEKPTKPLWRVTNAEGLLDWSLVCFFGITDIAGGNRIPLVFRFHRNGQLASPWKNYNYRLVNNPVWGTTRRSCWFFRNGALWSNELISKVFDSVIVLSIGQARDDNIINKTLSF